MDIDLSSEDHQFQGEVRQFLRDNALKPGEDYGKWRLEWFAKARDQGGWDVPKWPEEHGGPGWNPSQHYIWEQETAGANLPWDVPFGLGMLAPILFAYGNDEQKARFLPPIRARDVLWCQGYSEPGAGSDLAALRTRAVLSDDGSHYIVNGTKLWTTIAHIADWMFCLVRTNDAGRKQEGVTFLLFPMNQDGIDVQPIITLGGAHTVNTVHLTDVRVPVENRVGEEGKGWGYAKGLLEHERSGLAGISRSLVALAALKEKVRSVPVGNGNLLDDDGFRAKLGRLEVDLRALEYTELRSLASAAAGTDPGPESSILKLKGTEIQQRIQKLTVEAAGPFAAQWGGEATGVAFGHSATASYLSGRAYTIYGGASEVQKDVIARKVLGMRRDRASGGAS